MNGPYGTSAPWDAHRPSSHVARSPTMARSSESIRVFPSPASPTISSTWPRPASRSSMQAPSALNSRSRPTSGVGGRGSLVGRGPISREAGTGSRLPFTGISPSGSSTNRSESRDVVPGPTAMVPCPAADWRRAATFVVSPSATSCSKSRPTVPTAAGPLFSPTRTSKCSIPQAASTSTAYAAPTSTMRNAARAARSGSSSCATGTPKYAQIPSPM